MQSPRDSMKNISSKDLQKFPKDPVKGITVKGIILKNKNYLSKVSVSTACTDSGHQFIRKK